MSLVAAPAAAQTSAVRSAADAFGERVGIEQLGLYSESQVRGFDLQASGAYRIDDAYFSRATPLNDPVVAGVGVRVGVNAASLAYPAPSGVVTYRLREPAAVDFLSVGLGVRDYGTPTLELNGSLADSRDTIGVAGGLVWRPHSTWPSGADGAALDVGAVVRWKPLPAHTVRAFATVYDRYYDGDDALLPIDGTLPPKERRTRNYSPDWARVAATNVNVGLLYAGRMDDWLVDLSAFRSIYDGRHEDFTVVETRADGPARGRLLLTAPKTHRSDSVEARLGRVAATGALRHRAELSVRARRSRVELASTQTVALGEFDLSDSPAPSSRLTWTGTRGRDIVEQVTASAGYGVTWADRVRLRLGAHRTRYDKQVRNLSGSFTHGVDETTFFNASLVANVTSATTVFASWVTGLEETGVAPRNASNRDEVLAPVEAEQFELGVRQALTDQLTLIGAVFSVAKPTMGLRADNSFGLVGRVTHRGVEGSLMGRIDDRTSVVIGAVAIDPRVTGLLVDAGVVGREPVGLSEVVANASVERALGAGWSVDAQATYWGERWANARNSLKAPSVTTINLGVRRSFRMAGRPTQLRVLATNLTDTDGFLAAPSGLLSPVASRALRAMLTVSFTPDT